MCVGFRLWITKIWVYGNNRCLFLFDFHLQDFIIFSKFTLVATYFGDQGSKSRMCMVKGIFISILQFTLCFLPDFNFVLYKLGIETWHAFLNNKCLSYIFYDGCQNVSPFICTPSFSHSPVIYDIISFSFSALDRVFLELTTSWSRTSNSGQGWWMGAWEGRGGGTGEKHTESLLRAEALNEKYSHRKKKTSHSNHQQQG